MTGTWCICPCCSSTSWEKACGWKSWSRWTGIRRSFPTPFRTGVPRVGVELGNLSQVQKSALIDFDMKESCSSCQNYACSQSSMNECLTLGEVCRQHSASWQGDTSQKKLSELGLYLALNTGRLVCRERSASGWSNANRKGGCNRALIWKNSVLITTQETNTHLTPHLTRRTSFQNKTNFEMTQTRNVQANTIAYPGAHWLSCSEDGTCTRWSNTRRNQLDRICKEQPENSFTQSFVWIIRTVSARCPFQRKHCLSIRVLGPIQLPELLRGGARTLDFIELSVSENKILLVVFCAAWFAFGLRDKTLKMLACTCTCLSRMLHVQRKTLEQQHGDLTWFWCLLFSHQQFFLSLSCQHFSHDALHLEGQQRPSFAAVTARRCQAAIELKKDQQSYLLFQEFHSAVSHICSNLCWPLPLCSPKWHQNTKSIHRHYRSWNRTSSGWFLRQNLSGPPVVWSNWLGCAVMTLTCRYTPQSLSAMKSVQQKNKKLCQQRVPTCLGMEQHTGVLQNISGHVNMSNLKRNCVAGANSLTHRNFFSRDKNPETLTLDFGFSVSLL